MSDKQYAERDIVALDYEGGHYYRHVDAMTGEKLHGKSEIAAELGYRDMLIEQLQADNEAMKKLLEVSACPNTSCTDGAIPHQVGEDDWEAEQCQFCYEKGQALAHKED